MEFDTWIVGNLVKEDLVVDPLAEPQQNERDCVSVSIRELVRIIWVRCMSEWLGQPQVFCR